MYSCAFFFLLSCHVALGMIGYDCGSKQLNVTTISLLDVAECDIPESSINVTYKYVQLLQISDYTEIMVRQCKILIQRTVYHCGMFGHVGIVEGGVNEYLMDIGKRACDDAHLTGTIRLSNNHVVHGLKINDTITHGMTLAGISTRDGDCSGTGYSDPFGTWKDVVVQATVKITLTEQTARVKINSNSVHLRSGTKCSLSEGNCIDSDGGYSFWNSLPVDKCNFEKFSILYEGVASKIVNLDSSNNNEIVYSVTTKDITFALTVQGEEFVCGYKIIKTESPKLVIFETYKGGSFAERHDITIANLDIFLYVNAKFVYLEKHIRQQIKLLYKDVVAQRCMLERENMRNSLSLATRAPDQFAYDMMKGPGYMALVAGEVVHIIKCVPVEVKLQHGETCYTELQVSRNNQTFFLTPRTHILKSKGTETSCNRVLPAFYMVNDRWYRILPLPTESKAPTVVKPMTTNTWEYITPENLATSGIYTEKEIDQLREMIMFPVEKPSILNDLARGMQGHQVFNQDDGIVKLFNEDVVDKIIDNTWNKMWSRFLTFGTVSAGVIAILTIIHLIKMVVDIVIRGYAIHSIYGWSIHLLGAIWSSISHLLITLNKPTPENPMEIRTKEELREMQPFQEPIDKDFKHSNSNQQEIIAGTSKTFLQTIP